MTVVDAGSGEFQCWFGAGAELSRAEEQRIEAEAAAGLPELRLPQLFREKPGLLSACDSVVVARAKPGAAFTGLCAASFHPGAPSFLQLVISLTRAAYRRGPLLKSMWRIVLSSVAARCREFPGILALRTYSPAAFQAMSAVLRIPGVRVYPDVRADEQDQSLAKLATHIAARLNPDCAFEPGTGVLRRAGVPLDLYPALPEGGRAELRKYFERHLLPGDRMLCVLTASKQSARRRIAHAFGIEPSVFEGPREREGACSI